MILKEIEERTSVRKYSDKEISENDIKEILEAGRIAPSWVNAQPWHFIAVKDNETKNLLAQLANGQKQVANAKYVIVVVADIKEWDEDKFKKVLTNQLGMSDDVSNAILKDEVKVNLGAVYETVVTQELKAHGHNLYYYDRRKVGEVGYLIDDYSTLSVIPIEIKSGRDGYEFSALKRGIINMCG